MSGRKAFRLLLGVAVAALFVWLTLRQMDLARITEVLGGARLDLIAAASALLCAGYACRIARWRIMLARENPALRWPDCAGPLLAGFAANNVLPFRAGDVMRALAFNGRMGTTAGAVLATLFVERLLDLLMMLIMLGIALWSFDFDLNRLLGFGGPALLAAACGVLAVLLFPGVLKPLAKVLGALAGRLPAARRLQVELDKATNTLSLLAGGPVMAALIAWSAVAWLAEGGVYWLAAQALVSIATPAASWLALPVGTLATLIPSTPGYVGTFDYFTAQAMMTVGNERTASAIYAFLVHLILWLPPTVLGGLYMVLRPVQGGVPKESVT